MEAEKQKHSEKYKIFEKINKNAANGDETAIFLLNILTNYNRKVPRWNETSVRLCTVWRFCSTKGYEFCRRNLLKIPSKTTIARYLGNINSSNELIKQRLTTEVSNFKNPIERVCSLVIDDMAIRQKLIYSRSDDRLYGLSTSSSNTIGGQVEIAHQMMCYVVHGLTTRFTIPAGYFFHSSFTAEEFYSLTLKILKLVTDCGFLIIRIVTDNLALNVKLFKLLGNGTIQNVISHPYLSPLPLFLSFDYCHAIKNARNLFLQNEMMSSDGVISASFLTDLYDLQRDLPVKPVKFLTKKHLFPNNLEKMNVLRAIQIFYPSVTAALKFLNENGHELFQNVSATTKYLECMHHFFQIHNVSSKNQYIRSLDSSVAPYVNVSDERLHWLTHDFPQYIDDIQVQSQRAGLPGLSKETAHSLKFIARSTYLTVKFLLEEVGFYYVLTRTFSSDCIEAMFSHVRLRGGSNDATDARAAEYALKQILKCGIIKTSKSANVASNVDFVSKHHILPSTSSSSTQEHHKHCSDLVLPFTTLQQLRNLHNVQMLTDNTVYSASVAFLAGYIIKKMNDKFKCDYCVSSLLTKTIPGPLLRLINLQDRGGLTYPNLEFVAVLKELAEVIHLLIPHIEKENPCSQLIELITAHLVQNPIFHCSTHRTQVSQFIIRTAATVVLNNFCSTKTDLVKRKSMQKKPLSRKILKLN